MYFFQNVETLEYPVTPDQLRERHKQNVSFGPTVPIDVALQLGYRAVTVDTMPVFDALTHTCTANAPAVINAAWVQGWTVTPLSPEQIAANAAVTMQATITAFDTALTAHLDATAQAKRYDNRITCMVRAGFAGPFQAEGLAFATWCDSCNSAAYAMLAAVQAGTEPMPASPQAFIATLPVMVWPT